MGILTPHSTETTQVIKMKLCTFDNVGKTNTHAQAWFKLACWELLHATSFLPSFLRTYTGQTDRDNSTHNGSKDAVWWKEVPCQQVFFSMSTFWGLFYHHTPKNFSPSREIRAKPKSQITYKPFKIHQKCELNVNTKSESHFQNPQSKITWSAPL